MLQLQKNFIMIDGLDGVGKGTAIGAIVDFYTSFNKRSLDLDQFWRTRHFHPDFENPESQYYVDINSFDFVISSEPTYCGIGKAIREEVISKSSRKYSAKSTAECYSIDREILYKRVLLPILELGKVVIQSRSVSTSLAYQYLQAKESGEDFDQKSIMDLEGNSFALSYPFGLFIIPTIKDVPSLMQRLQNREKKDDCAFENIDFQLKLKEIYESEDYRSIFESRGTKIEYIDAGVSVEETKRQAVQVFREYLGL